jgi:hypothetical protein
MAYRCRPVSAHRLYFLLRLYAVMSRTYVALQHRYIVKVVIERRRIPNTEYRIPNTIVAVKANSCRWCEVDDSYQFVVNTAFDRVCCDVSMAVPSIERVRAAF